MNLYKELTAAAKKIDKDAKNTALMLARVKTEADEKTGRPASDFYYILTGYYMVKVDAALYNTAIRPAAPVFIELEAGEGARRDPGASMPRKSEPVRVLDIIPKDAGQRLDYTGYIMAGKHAPRMFAADTFKIAISDNYMSMLEPFMHGELYAAGPTFPAQCEGLKNPEIKTGVLVLPVRIAADMKYQVVKAEEIGTKTEREARKAAKEEAAGIIEAAKKEAAGIIEKAKSSACNIASDISSQGKQSGHEMLKEAREKAAAILKNAEEIRNAAKTDYSNEIHEKLTAATEEAAEIVKKARAEAVATLKAAEEERARIIAGERDAAPEEVTPEAAPEVKPEEVKQEAKKARLVRNEEKHGIELYFQEVPRATVRNTLKAGGYKWHATKQCWYSKATDKAEKIAAALIG